MDRRRRADSGTPNENSQGLEFEMYVGFVYESLGFRVERNVNLSGQQIDLLAHKFVPGVGPTTILVECKWRSRGSISNQEVFAFHQVIISLRQGHKVTRGVMVSNVQFSQDAFLAAEGIEDIELVQIQDLENQFLDLRQTFKSFTERYEELPIFLSYIHLHGRWSADGIRTKYSDDIEETIVDWLDQKEGCFISILGDFGAGKTTILERLKYIYAQRYIQQKPTLIPLFFPLKKANSYGSTEEFIRVVLRTEFERETPLSVFWKTLRSGRLLLLLDGFDEMSPEVDETRKRENFSALIPLIGKSSHTVMTCRPSYFVRAEEYMGLIHSINRPDLSPSTVGGAWADQIKHRVLSRIESFVPVPELPRDAIRRVELDLLDESQIDTFLLSHDPEYRRICGCDWQAVKSFLFGIYDLQDLMSRPILLTMINETILAGKLEMDKVSNDIGPSALYEIYTTMKLDLDWRKGETRHLIPKIDRLRFAQTVALAMFEKNTLEMSYPSLLDLASTGFNLPIGRTYLENMQPAVLASDVQICSFLTRSDDVFRFTHRSFMEYFVALSLKDYVLTANRPPWAERPLPREILYFVGGFAIADSQLRHKIIAWYLTELSYRNANMLRNLAGAALYSGRIQEKLQLKDTDISGIDGKNLRLIKPTWSDVHIKGAKWENIEVANPEIQALRIDSCKLANWSINAGLLDADISRSEIYGLNTIETTIRLRSIASTIQKALFSNQTIDISGEINFSESTFNECEIQIDTPLGSGIRLTTCNFNNATIILLSHGGIAAFRSCSFRGCHIFGFRMSMHSYKSLDISDSAGLIAITDSDMHFQENFISDPDHPRIILTHVQSFRNSTVIEEISRLFGMKWSPIFSQLVEAEEDM